MTNTFKLLLEFLWPPTQNSWKVMDWLLLASIVDVNILYWLLQLTVHLKIICFTQDKRAPQKQSETRSWNFIHKFGSTQFMQVHNQMRCHCSCIAVVVIMRRSSITVLQARHVQKRAFVDTWLLGTFGSILHFGHQSTNHMRYILINGARKYSKTRSEDDRWWMVGIWRIFAIHSHKILQERSSDTESEWIVTTSCTIFVQYTSAKVI